MAETIHFHAARFRERIQKRKGKAWRANLEIVSAGKTLQWYYDCTKRWADCDDKLQWAARLSFSRVVGIDEKTLDRYWKETR